MIAENLKRKLGDMMILLSMLGDKHEKEVLSYEKRIQQLNNALAEAVKQSAHWQEKCQRNRTQRNQLVVACQQLLSSPEVQSNWPLDGLTRAQKPSDVYSSASTSVKFRRLLAINALLESFMEGEEV